MKAITIKNPWAYLICSGEKDIENRSWRTNFRGRVLIHTAKTYDCRDFVPRVICPSPQSAIIGSVEIVDCIWNSSSKWSFSDCWNWVLENPELFDHPILDIRGALSFWDVPEGICIPRKASGFV